MFNYRRKWISILKRSKKALNDNCDDIDYTWRDSHRNQRVQFGDADVILIPSKNDYIQANINHDLWYNNEDYIKFAQDNVLNTKETSK